LNQDIFPHQGYFTPQSKFHFQFVEKRFFHYFCVYNEIAFPCRLKMEEGLYEKKFTGVSNFSCIDDFSLQCAGSCGNGCANPHSNATRNCNSRRHSDAI
jgi:hypothetical protein